MFEKFNRKRWSKLVPIVEYKFIVKSKRTKTVLGIRRNDVNVCWNDLSMQEKKFAYYELSLIADQVKHKYRKDKLKKNKFYKLFSKKGNE